MPCSHPLSSLKVDNAQQLRPGALTVKFWCQDCLAPLTKEFLLTVPEPEAPASGIEELLSDSPTIPAPKVRRGENSPWRHFNTPTL